MRARNNSDLYVVARRNGAGNVSVSNRNNSTGTATVNWTPEEHPALWCDGPYSQHLRQDSTVIVQNSDDNMTGSAQFNATALPASECSDECTLDILWCQVDEDSSVELCVLPRLLPERIVLL